MVWTLQVYAYRPQRTTMCSFLVNTWWVAFVMNAKIHMLVTNLSGALYGTAIIDVIVAEVRLSSCLLAHAGRSAQVYVGHVDIA